MLIDAYFSSFMQRNAAASATDKQIAQSKTDMLRKLVDDFEYLQSTTQIGGDALYNNSFQLGNALQLNQKLAVLDFFKSLLIDNLQRNCLCAALQALVADKELLNYYYALNAFLQDEEYATAFFICISSLELRQFSLLSQINEDLYATLGAQHSIGMPKSFSIASRHKRSTSHPVFSISPPKKQDSCNAQAKHLELSKPAACNLRENKVNNINIYKTIIINKI